MLAKTVEICSDGNLSLVLADTLSRFDGERDVVRGIVPNLLDIFSKTHNVRI
jgi:hypothetical protein